MGERKLILQKQELQNEKKNEEDEDTLYHHLDRVNYLSLQTESSSLSNWTWLGIHQWKMPSCLICSSSYG